MPLTSSRKKKKKVVFNINLFTTALLCERNSLSLNESAVVTQQNFNGSVASYFKPSFFLILCHYVSFQGVRSILESLGPQIHSVPTDTE